MMTLLFWNWWKWKEKTKQKIVNWGMIRFRTSQNFVRLHCEALLQLGCERAEGTLYSFALPPSPQMRFMTVKKQVRARTNKKVVSVLDTPRKLWNAGSPIQLAKAHASWNILSAGEGGGVRTQRQFWVTTEPGRWYVNAVFPGVQ